MFHTSQSTTEFRSSTTARHTTPWEVEKDFIDQSFDAVKGGVCVRVSVLRLEYPKYSYLIGWKNPTTSELKIHFQSDQKVDSESLRQLLVQAQAYIAAEVAKVEEAREKKNAEYQKRVEEEKLRVARKKKQYEANVEQRRIENRQRSQGGGGGGKNKK